MLQLNGKIVTQESILQTLKKTAQEKIDEKIEAKKTEVKEKIIEGVKISFGGDITIEYNLNYPSLLNDKDVHHNLSETLTNLFGKEKIIPIDAILGSEDFAFYSRKVPSMFYFLGAKDIDNNQYFLHDSKVTFNEDSIPYGAELLAEGALTLLKNH